MAGNEPDKSRPERVRPEVALVTLCARPTSCALELSDVTPLIADIEDWDSVVELVRRHRTTPLLYRHLNALGSAAIPAAAFEKLHRLFLANAARNEIIIRELFRILDLLEANDIKALPFKGPVLAQRAHGDISLRQFDDLDFLLDEQDIMPAANLLMKQGYGPMIDLSNSERVAHLKAGWGYSLQNTATRIHVELDCAIGTDCFSFRPDPDWLSRDQTTVTLSGKSVPAIGTETLFLFLCVHGTKHVWSRLSWVSDIAAVLKSEPDLDWQRLLDRARACGAKRMLLLGLRLAEKILSAELPSEIREAIGQDSAVEGLCDWINSNIYVTPSLSLSSLQTIRFHLRTRERTRDRIRYLFLLVFTPSYSDWKALRLPGYLFSLYYFIRPFRLTWQLLRRILTRSPGSS
jgi:hypothetical protein